VFAALLKLHLRVGARLALRAAAPIVGLPIVALGIQQNPGGALRETARFLFAPPGQAGGTLAVAAVAMMLAAWAAPRVTCGLAGWSRHLPVTETTQRLAALAAIVTAQAPLVCGLLLLAPIATCPPGSVSPGRVVALVVAMTGAAVVAWPGQRRWRSALLALASLAVAAPAGLPGDLAAVLLLAAATALAGPLSPRAVTRVGWTPAGLPVPVLIAARALGRTAVLAVVLSSIPLAMTAAFRINNPDLSPAVAAGAARLGGGLAVTILIGALVERLAVRRSVWSWARSLPAGAVRRVDGDAVILAAACLIPLAVTAWLDAMSAVWVAMSVPAFALRGAGMLRASLDTRIAPSGRLLAEGALGAAWLALLPWLGLFFLAAAPWSRRIAADRDRLQRVSRWEERHHDTAGDPASWSGR
jgi:hypothetical protein